MENYLNDLILLIRNNIVDKHTDTIIVEVTIGFSESKLLSKFYDEDLIESVKNSQEKIIDVSQINNYTSQSLYIEFVIAELKGKGFYVHFNDFILNNRFKIPNQFYISELDFLSSSGVSNEKVEKYYILVELIYKLSSIAKITTDNDVKTLYLVQENLFVELPIDNITYENYLHSKDIQLISFYINNIDSYKEKKIIYIRELIDFLVNVNTVERFQYLLSSFKEFYERCNASFEYYLSNFSFNKVKLELDNSVLEYSKNIRAIINESQSKLIAIPAAFVLASSQLDFKNTFSLRNILILVSSFMFSYIISLFIKNQKNALVIVSDNISNFKNSFKRSKKTIFEDERELEFLADLIKNSYAKIDIELQKQKARLFIFICFNWGISITMFLILITTKYYSEIWQLLKKYLFIE